MIKRTTADAAPKITEKMLKKTQIFLKSILESKRIIKPLPIRAKTAQRAIITGFGTIPAMQIRTRRTMLTASIEGAIYVSISRTITRLSISEIKKLVAPTEIPETPGKKYERS